MTVVVAIVLGLLQAVLKPSHQKNEAIFNKRAVLSAVRNDVKNLSDDEVVAIFDKDVVQKVLDINGNEVSPDKVKELRGFKDKAGKAEDLNLSKEKKRDDKDRLFPLYVYNTAEGENYITAVRGKGLWDEIWGYVAIQKDLSTIAGVAFDHKAETPGLGAEIKDNPAFPAQFKGDKLYNKEGEFVSVLVKKGGSDKDDPHAVDAISGATVTCDGVTDMLEEGIRYYEPYFDKLKGENK
jgi:Na+-transporting NADH:ubiquinone oxidoreductase subunit C